MDNQKNHSRILKNSLFLYFRMILTLVVTLYTSRVVLNVLGVEDFGIYNVVGGVVTMMAFLSGAMSSATQRFLSFELGKGDVKQLNNVFKMSMNIHLLIIFIIVLVAETVGLWFVNTQLVIPVERIAAANWVFHCALFSFCCAVMSVPYNAAIIAHEKMSAFAYVSIIDVLLKLSVVFILARYGDDKLELYALLLTLVSVTVFCCYYFYARWHFTITKFSLYWNSKLFSTLFSYTGWNLFGNLAFVMSSQGINILLNIFFGAYVNAARAIAIQVNSAINGFVSSLQVSINPQITKSYAIDDISYMHKLVFSGARFTFYLLLILSLPVFIETHAILALWLDDVPQYADIFVKLILVESSIICLSGTLMTSAQATGNIKLYQAVVGGLQLLNVPFSLCLLWIYSSPLMVFYVSIAISLISLIVRMIFLKELVGLSINKFVVEVLFLSAKVTLLTIVIFKIVSFFILSFISGGTIYLLFLNVFVLFFITISVIYFFGLMKDEKAYVNKFIVKKIGVVNKLL